ncbi:DUF1707 and DUF2154 domain-containing protein [Actinocrinis puniceicyclus]|uniref:DUF1707 and DUF2154 domain-containing protein n=1 Tax=Actinocrinis puniceicyclus TaxID=977794 RepID=A0A8J7WHV7_9ACTN|nr:DUF1707 domain-containing protein [Actinocrinis puniceicyclus]MBS2962441.1 DUF1707 and DUF2154 domain-containing protein [Actinocrinis puniceicyclus]
MTSPAMRGPEDREFALRASDADREHVAELLGRAFAEGRLSTDEHSERLEAAYAAKTMGELRPLVADLPVVFAPPTASSAAAVLAGTSVSDAAMRYGGEPVVAVFGEAKRTGRWLVRSGLNARALFGSVELDLTEAVLEQREITITANAIFGEVIIRVPDGVILHDEGSAVFGSRKLPSLSGTVFGPETPVVHVRGIALFGNVEGRGPRRKWFRSR